MASLLEILNQLFNPRRLDVRQPVLTPGAQRIEIAGTEPVTVQRPGLPPFRQDLPVTEIRRDPPVLAERVISTSIAPPVLASLADFFVSLNDPRLAAQQSEGRILQAQNQLEQGRRLAIDQSQLALTADELGQVAEERAEGRRLRRANFGLSQRRQTLDEQQFLFDVAKFNERAKQDAAKLGFDLGNTTELATVSVLGQLGINTDDPAAVRAALANPATLASIGRAVRRLKPDDAPKELRTLSERLASRFFNPQREPVKYSELVLEIERELRATGSDSVSERAALNAELTNLRTERTSIANELRTLESNITQGFIRGEQKAPAQAKVTALNKRIAQLNTRMNEIITEFRTLGQQGGRKLQIAPTGETGTEQGQPLRSLSTAPQLTEQERQRLSGLIGAFGGPLPPQQGRTLQRATPEGPAGQVPAGQVKVRAPNGEVGLIPVEDLTAALGQGYQVVP